MLLILSFILTIHHGPRGEFRIPCLWPWKRWKGSWWIIEQVYLHWLHEVLVPFGIMNFQHFKTNNHESSRISFFPNIYPNMIRWDKMGVDFTSRSFKAPKIPAAWHREMTRLPTLQPRRHEVGFQPMGGWGGDTWSTDICWWSDIYKFQVVKFVRFAVFLKMNAIWNLPCYPSLCYLAQANTSLLCRCVSRDLGSRCLWWA